MASYGFYGPNYANPYQAMYPQVSYPQMAQPQMQTAPQMQAQMQPQSQPMPMQNQNSIIWVSGLAEAQTYPTAPNSAVVLWENSGKTIFLKSADATGKPSIRIYDLVERTETASATQEKPAEKMPDYATKEDVATLAGAVKGILGDIEQMRGDLYGVAGRKKTAKKAETETEE